MSEPASETPIARADGTAEQQVSPSVTPPPYEGWCDEALVERCLLLEAERDRAREECGYEKVLRKSCQQTSDRYLTRLIAARTALVGTGYFTEAELGHTVEIAPRITEYAAAFRPCFCGDVALMRGGPLVAHGVEHDQDGCSYTQPAQALVAPAADEPKQAGRRLVQESAQANADGAEATS